MTNEQLDKKDKEKFDFCYKSFSTNLNVVKYVGIENLTGSILVEINQHIVTQKIHLDDFTKKTILPLKSQIEGILIDFSEKDKREIINSVVTCINKYDNIKKIIENYRESDRMKN